MHPRKMLPPGETRKRKDREALRLHDASCSNPNNSSNRLLVAGYMAYEFLTKGTLFGHKFQAPAAPLAGASSPATATITSTSVEFESKRKEKVKKEQHHSHSHSYREVASMLKTDGTHIPGIVNPTQLSGWIQM